MLMNFMLLKFDTSQSQGCICVSYKHWLQSFEYPYHRLGRIGQAVQKGSGRVTKNRGLDIED